MQVPEVFVIAPLDPQGQRVQDTVRRAVQEAGLTVVHNRHAVHPGAEMTSSILDGIRRADLIIADVSRLNPNVLYELGFAHALRKPTILLFDTTAEYKLPSDLAGLQYIPYTTVNLTALADRVKSETKALTAERRSA